MAYLKPQAPLMNGADYVYPITTADQIVLSDGTRLEKDGVVVAPDSEKLGGVAASSYKLKSDASAYKYTATLSASSWSSSAPYTQSITVTGILATDMPVVDLNMSSATVDTASDLQDGWACVGRIVTSANMITAYCYENVPEVDLPISLLVVR